MPDNAWLRRDDTTMPSSLAGKIYDLYGDIGIDAMKVQHIPYMMSNFHSPNNMKIEHIIIDTQ